MEDVGTVSKGGEIILQTSFVRIPKGLLANVKVHPRIEEFMRELGSTQEIQEASMYGRLWSPRVKDTGLPVYGLPPEESISGWIRNGNGPLYRIDKVAARLSENIEGTMGVNLSFLRLVGASEGNGVTFIVDGVYEAEGIKTLNRQIGDAVKGFYVNFLKPVNVSVILSTQEI